MTEYFDVYGMQPLLEKKPEERPRIRSEGRVVYLSKSCKINISDRETLLNWGIFGRSGGGKTTTLMLIANQYKNAIVFDTKGSAEKILERYDLKDWELFHIGDSGLGERLKINVFELPPTIVNVLYSNTTRAERRRLAALRPFLALEAKRKQDLPKVMAKKTYANFRELLYNLKLEYILDDELSLILAEDDKGMDLADLCRGKKLIDVSSYDYKNRSIGVLVDALFSKVKSNPYLQSERLLIATDDIQKVGARDTAFGRALGKVFSECRTYNISALVSGTSMTELDKDVKENISILIIFETSYNREQLRKLYDIYVDDLTFEEHFRVLGPKGTALVKTDESLPYSEGKIVHFDLDFFHPELMKREKKPKLEIDTHFIDIF